MLRVLPSPIEMARTDALSELARSASTGKREAVRALLEQVAPAVIGTIDRAIGHDHRDADDIAQEALIAFLSALKSFRYECSVVHFAKRVAIRVVTAHLRKKRALRRAEGATTLDPDLGETSESTELSPLAETLSQRRMELFRQVIGDLPPALGEAFALKMVLGHSVEEVADATNSNINTVRSRLQTAKQLLRERISSDPKFAELREQEEK